MGYFKSKLENKSSNPFDLELPELMPFQEHVKIIQSQSTASHYRVFLDSGIEEPSKYRDLIQILISASPSDLVEFVVSCDGGNLDTTIDITNALRATEASTRAVITSKAHSGASMISLACDEVIAMPHSAMLIHQPRGGILGRHCEIIQQGRFEDDWIGKFYFDIYADFFTKEEIQSILDGKDVWLGHEQINERAQKRDAIREKQQKKQERELKRLQKKLIAECEEFNEDSGSKEVTVNVTKQKNLIVIDD